MNKVQPPWRAILACAVLGLTACGGGGSSSSDNNDAGSPAQTAQGVFIDSAVEGLEFASGQSSGVTDVNGTFTYEAGNSITFRVGDIEIGSATGGDTLTPLSLVTGAVDETDPQVVNIARFLQTLDDDGNADNGITITQLVRDQAASQSIEFDQSLNDFTDDGTIQTIEQLMALFEH